MVYLYYNEMGVLTTLYNLHIEMSDICEIYQPRTYSNSTVIQIFLQFLIPSEPVLEAINKNSFTTYISLIF